MGQQRKQRACKPFDLATARQGAPVCTRDGRQARIICTDRRTNLYPVVALVTDAAGDEDAFFYTPGGRFYADGRDSGCDLVMQPERREGWVNVVRFGQEHNVGCLYRTKEDALRHVDAAGNGYVATVRVEWEE